ncbi:MAG: hypothetical protein EPO21_13085 [Chloroflexota bacterium]|nr:MAG: hypothetical protein EPO21_13085 [Chloroflexota bacterium]
MKARTITPWRGERPSRQLLQQRITQALGIVRPEGYRLVRDPWGNRVKVDRQHVLEHIAMRSDDAGRWRFIPAIVETIKRATELYEKDVDRTRTYFAPLPVRHRGGVVKETSFVLWARPRDGEWSFASMVPREPRKAEKARKKAGRLIATRPDERNPAYMGSWEPGGEDRAAQRLPGAAPALHHKNSTRAQSTSRDGAVVLALGVLLALALMIHRQEASQNVLAYQPAV